MKKYMPLTYSVGCLEFRFFRFIYVTREKILTKFQTMFLSTRDKFFHIGSILNRIQKLENEMGQRCVESLPIKVQKLEDELGHHSGKGYKKGLIQRVEALEKTKDRKGPLS